MSKLFVEKSIEIHAPAAKVWEVLTKKDFTVLWATYFMNGAEFYIESDWQLGSPVLWKDKADKVIVEGTVKKIEPKTFLRFTVSDVRGEKPLMREEDGITYQLSEENGNTVLNLLQGDFSAMEDGEKYRNMSEEIWDKVLPKMKDLAEWLEKLEKEGFKNIMSCANPPHTEFHEHTHEQHTVHVVLEGDLTLREKTGEKTIQEGERFEIPAGTTHNAACGPQGCTFLVGVKT